MDIVFLWHWWHGFLESVMGWGWGDTYQSFTFCFEFVYDSSLYANHFLKTIFFRAIWGSQQSWEEGTSISCVFLAPIHAASPPSTSPTRVTHAWQWINLHGHITTTQVHGLDTGLTLGGAHSLGFDKSTMTVSGMQCNDTAPKVLCVLPPHILLPHARSHTVLSTLHALFHPRTNLWGQYSSPSTDVEVEARDEALPGKW